MDLARSAPIGGTGRVEHRHFRAPTVFPVVGVAVSVALIAQNDAEVFGRAAALLLVGVLFWVANRVLHREPARARPSSS